LHNSKNNGQSDKIYSCFQREQWRCFSSGENLTLQESDLAALRGVNETVSLDEVEEVYLPLAKLLHLLRHQFLAHQQVVSEFLAESRRCIPYIVGIAGSVAVGKSTTARLMQALLVKGWDLRVDIVATDGFLMSKTELSAKNLMSRKGFPESYHLDKLLDFLCALKSGKQYCEVPMYSHEIYDIVPDERQVIEQPDVVIIEGLNILQTGPVGGRSVPAFVSDFLDFSLFVHANEAHIEHWFIERVVKFCSTEFNDPDAYFYFLSQMSEVEVRQFAAKTWREINGLNLRENILPFKDRADCILNKSLDHSVQSVQLRQ
jgi:type I pantothenate kinase